MEIILKSKWEKYFDRLYPGEYNKRSINELEMIYRRFIKQKLNDAQFDSEINSECTYRYYQRLSEMLFADILFQEKFELESNNKGPDLYAIKNKIGIWFEIITPQPDDFMIKHNEDIKSRLTPDPEKNREFQERALLRITSALKEKIEKYKSYLLNGTVKPNDICVIVINDTLLWIDDLPMVGLGVGAMKGIASDLIFEALCGYGGHLYKRDEISDNHEKYLWRREKIKNINNSDVDTNKFLNGSVNFISAVFHVTLREEYALSIILKEHKNSTPDLLYKYSILNNSNATNPFPEGLVNAKIWHSKMFNELYKNTATINQGGRNIIDLINA